MMRNIGDHATFTFEQVEAEGAAARPLDFPAPLVRRGVRVNALVVHPTTGQRDILPGVIHRASYTNGSGHDHDRPDKNETSGSSGDGDDPKSQSRQSSDGQHKSTDSNKEGSRQTTPDNTTSNRARKSRASNREPEYIAYFPQRRLQDAIYGSVWACLVLHRHYGPAADDAARAANVAPGDPNAPIVWEIVGRHVAIKMVEWSRVHQARGRLLEDPVKEIAAMQLIGTDHPHVLGSMEVLQDDEFLFSIMPYAKGGDLFGYVVRDTELRGGEGGMSEPVARYWFRQLLEVRIGFENIVPYP